jgi:hypothetical protein
MRPIDADALKIEMVNLCNQINSKNGITIPTIRFLNIIDNAPELGYEDGILSVENAVRKAIELEDAYNNGWTDGFFEGENERPKGEWITNDRLREGYYICSNCKEISCCKGNFCTDCGADMRGDNNG